MAIRREGKTAALSWQNVAGAALACALAAACASSLEGLGSFPCAQDGSCPDGWQCIHGSCFSFTADAGATAQTRACESHDQCDEAGIEGACLSSIGGSSACSSSCTGFPGGCSGQDCKLILSGEQGSYDLVPACTTAGPMLEDQACTSVNSCTFGYTCAVARYGSNYVCTEICTPFKASCTNLSKSCVLGVENYPHDWGLCY